MAQIVTENEADTAAIRIQAVGSGSFQVRLQEERASADGGVHVAESIHYLAMEVGDYPTLETRVGVTLDEVTHASYALDFGGAVGTGSPLVLTGMQTTNDATPCAIRWQESTLSNGGVSLFLQEENSDRQGGSAHGAEAVGWIVFGSP